MKMLLDDFRAFLRSLACAGDGLVFTIRSQRNFRIHLAVGAAVLIAGGLVHLNLQEFILLLLTVILVLLAEMINTALEFAMNLVEAREHPVVRHAKDVAAAAVLVAVLGSVVVGVLLFGPKLLSLWRRG